MEVMTGRKNFDQNLYKENDHKGKVFAKRILSKTTQFANGKFEILDTAEDKKCGDVKIKLNDNSIRNFEIECAGADRFNKNFLGLYDFTNVPDKLFGQIPEGYFVVVDSSEDINTEIPKRFYVIKVDDILNCEKKASMNKYSDGKAEFFYKVPSELVMRFIWDEAEQKYVRYYP